MSPTSAWMIGKVSSPGALTAMPSAIVGRLGAARQAGALAIGRRAGRRLDADDLDVGLDRLGRGRHARDQAAAADRHHQHVQIRRRRQHLERERALARDDQRIVVGMDEGQVALGRDLAREHRRVLDRIALEHDLGAELRGLLDLHERRQARHHDGRRNPEPRRVAGHALGMIAGRHGDHAARPLLLR